MSEPMLQIGNNIDKGYVTDVATAIESVFKAGYDNRVEQETLRAALLVLREMSAVNDTTVTNSVFNGGNPAVAVTPPSVDKAQDEEDDYTEEDLRTDYMISQSPPVDCPKCKGAGLVEIFTGDVSKVKCPDCDGTGKVIPEADKS